MLTTLVLLAASAGGATSPAPSGLLREWSPLPGATHLPQSVAPASSDDVVTVAFSASGGTITRSGLYTSGATGGTTRVVATSGTLADTTTVRVAVPPPPSASTTAAASAGAAVGIPFGPFGAWQGASLRSHTDGFTLGLGPDNPSDITRRIAAARANRKKLLLAMTGGHHSNYKTGGSFDMGKWLARMNEYNTTSIRQAVDAGVADGTIIGSSVMDEPHNTSRENSWGPPGTMTKARVDEMCAYVKQMFPNLPVGVVHDYRVFEPERDYTVCDFVVSQYRESKGSITAFRDNGLAFARRSGISIAFSLNVLDGGTRMSGCPVPATGGPGTYGGNCRMRPDQIREYGLLLGPAGCALTMWRYDSSFMADPENRRAFDEVAAALASLPHRSCRRQ